jgi:hypothetical protein
MSSSVLGPADDSAARPGSCRKPPGALYVKSGKEWDLLAFAFCRPLRTDTLLAKRWRGAYCGTRRWPKRMSHRPTDAAAEREVLPLRRQGPNIVERAAILPDVVAPRERRAKLANGRPPSLTVAVAQIGRRPSERPNATPPGSPRSWPGCPAAPTRPSSCAPLTPASVDARQRRWSATQPAQP